MRPQTPHRVLVKQLSVCSSAFARSANLYVVKKFLLGGTFAACRLLFVSAFPLVLSAQPATPNVVVLEPSIPAARAPIAQHIEGTIEVVGFGRTQRADVKFSAPDSLFVHIQGDATQNVPDEIYIARGATQTTYNADSGRVRRWNWSSAQQPWRSQALADGGPANLVLWGWNPQAASKFYHLKAAKNGDITTVTMTAKNGRRDVYDSQRSGGRGDRVVFAVLKRSVYDWPRTVIMGFDANGKIISQERRDECNRVLDKTTFLWNGDFPSSATTRDANNAVSRWSYNLKIATNAHDISTFDLTTATKGANKNQIVEDAELLPIPFYAKLAATTQGLPRATALFHLGAAHIRQSEDMTAARKALESASKLAPQAVAPPLQLFDLALQTRDKTRAQRVLQTLTTLVGADALAVVERRAQLATLQRDWSAAQTALETLIAARADTSSSETLSARLQLARLQMLRGDLTNARQTLSTILAVEPTKSVSSESNALFTTAQSSAQASAAVLWADLFTDKDAKIALQNAPQKSEAQKLARALGGLKTETSATFSTSNATLLLVWGEALALSGKTAEANATFSVVATRGDVISSTRAHRALMVLGAMSGNAANSLRSFNVVLRRDADEETRAFTRLALFEAWRRNGRGDALKRVLEAHSIAPSSTDDDARLWLAWQENYAATDAIGATVRNYAAKYRTLAWWQSRLAEQLSSEAEPLKKDAQGRGIKLTQEAIVAVERAISLDKTQSYYPVQRAFILTFRANDLRKAGVNDATATVAAVDAAQAALNDLRLTHGSDPEVSISVAAAQQALSTRDNGAIADFTRGLNGGLPGRSSSTGERHNTAFAARQALAIALRRQQKWQEAAAQYDNLMAGAQNADEEVGITFNYLVLLRLNASDDTKTLATGAAQLLSRLSVEPWALEDADAATRAFATLLQNDSKLWPEVISILRGEKSDSSRLALCYLAFSIQNGLTSMAAQPNNEPETTTYLKSVLQQIAPLANTAEENLETVASSDDALIAARAHWLLAQRNLARNEFADAQNHLRDVVATEPDFAEARMSLARALLAENKNDEAREVLDTLQQTLPQSAVGLQNIAALLGQSGDEKNAHRVLELAWNEAQFSSATSTQSAQRIAYQMARVRLKNDQVADAATLYNKLSDASWTRLERAAALLDWENFLRAAGKTADAVAVKIRRDALKLSPAELQRVQEFLRAL